MEILKTQQKHKVLRDKAFNIAKDPKYDGYKKGLASLVYKLFDKKYAGSGVKSIPQNERPLDLSMQQLAEELHKPIIRIAFFKKSIFNIQRQDLGC